MISEIREEVNNRIRAITESFSYSREYAEEEAIAGARNDLVWNLDSALEREDVMEIARHAAILTLFNSLYPVQK